MGQKVHPCGLRLGLHRKWYNNWIGDIKENRKIYFFQKNIETFMKAFFHLYFYTKKSLTKRVSLLEVKLYKSFLNLLYVFVFFYKMRTKKRKQILNKRTSLNSKKNLYNNFKNKIKKNKEKYFSYNKAKFRKFKHKKLILKNIQYKKSKKNLLLSMKFQKLSSKWWKKRKYFSSFLRAKKKKTSVFLETFPVNFFKNQHNILKMGMKTQKAFFLFKEKRLLLRKKILYGKRVISFLRKNDHLKKKYIKKRVYSHRLKKIKRCYFSYKNAYKGRYKVGKKHYTTKKHFFQNRQKKVFLKKDLHKAASISYKVSLIHKSKN